MTKNRSCLPLILLLLGFMLIAGWLGLKGWRIYQAATHLQSQQAEIEGLLDNGINNIDPDRAEQLVTDVRADILTIERESAIFMPLMPYLGWVPRLGPTLVAAPQLIEMASAGSEAAAYGLRGLKPGLSILQSGNGNTIAALMGVLDSAAGDLAQAELALARVTEARANLPNEAGLPWTLRQLLPKADELLPTAQNGLAVSQILPALMGANEPQTYLIIAQNEDELRATGGFISGVGLLVVQNGQIISLEFSDANLVYDLTKPNDLPPPPLEIYMGLELFLLRDANYWADFPTSAENAISLYSYGLSVPEADGVIAVDQQFVVALVQAVGRVNVSGFDAPITPSNIDTWLQEAWGGGDGTIGNSSLQRKDFIGLLAGAIREKVENDPGSLDFIQLMQSMNQAALEKDLQVYMRDPIIAEKLAAVGWDGQVTALPEQDQLMLVQTNMGFNKVNTLTESSLDYSININENGAGFANLKVTTTNLNQPSSNPCIHAEVYTTETRYSDLIDRCYWGYVRVYAPTGSVLNAGISQPIPAQFFVTSNEWDGIVKTIPDPSQLTVFEDFWLIPQGGEHIAQYQYQLPTVVKTNANGDKAYQLTIYKQAGANPHPAQISIQLPPDVTIISTPAESTIVNNNIAISANINQNITFTIIYR